ncbi:MAG: hypothetical protein CTY34_05795 [Methylobacter sp.]|nr:MAG: hypothetical protein CTY34_05795 [Methylobacter sp.]PPD03592.1 MAG: hypothetical protein CTY29_09060 [Methylobacter sp.]
MRFFVTGEQHRKSLMNALVLMFMGYVVMLWLVNGLMYFHRMGLTPDSVIAYYLGSEQAFTQPKSYESILEVTHFHLFSMGMLVLTLTHLMLMTEFSTRLKIWLSGIIYLSAIGDEVASWLVRFVHPAFAYFKIAAFLALEISLLVLLIVVIASLFHARGQLKDLNKIFPTENAEKHKP